MAQFDHEGPCVSKCASDVGCFISEWVNMPHVCWHVDISQSSAHATDSEGFWG